LFQKVAADNPLAYARGYAKMKSIGIIANPQKPVAAQTVRRLKQLLRGAGVTAHLEHEAAKILGFGNRGATVPQLSKTCDLLVVLGGDGTILRVARELHGAATPILGVNLGSLGFLTSTPLKKLESAVRSVLRGECTLSSRATLQMRVRRGKRSFPTQHALNDVVLSRSSVSRVVKVEVSVDGQLLTAYYCDGIIFATPTGSTAYSMSAGGPILTPETKAFVITPICPHPFNDRPLVVPFGTVATVRLLSVAGKPLLTVDGQVQKMLKVEDVVEITGGTRTVQLVTLRGRSYYDVLREKLKWSGLDAA
jgi:NAD+ kinase